MQNKSAIIIFTRDRPYKLIQALQSINNVDYPIVIIDDSVKEMNQVKNREILSTLSHSYLGQLEFLEFIKEYDIDISEFSFY